MIDKKYLYIANFNCTFGKDDEPMLYYFEDIVLRAFKKGIIFQNKQNGNKYNFEGIKLIIAHGVFVLAGLIVKRTYLDIKSMYKEGKLTNTNLKVPSDPYSYFIINLQNHRMALVKNQKGSPTVGDFDKTASYVLKTFVEEINTTNIKKLPKPRLNVVSIPYSGKIEEELKKVAKIEKAILRFYPLNGDICTNNLFNELRKMLKEVESKSGSTQVNHPKNHKKIANIIKDTKGLVKPTIRVEYDSGIKRTLRDKDFSEKIEIYLDDNRSFDNNIEIISSKVINQKEYNETSDENLKIYKRFFGRLMALTKTYLK